LPKGEIKKICFSKGGEELGVFSTVLSKEKREEKRGVFKQRQYVPLIAKRKCPLSVG
jgi:hypothetical protein